MRCVCSGSSKTLNSTPVDVVPPLKKKKLKLKFENKKLSNLTLQPNTTSLTETFNYFLSTLSKAETESHKQRYILISFEKSGSCLSSCTY